jgi:hypothetical protein
MKPSFILGALVGYVLGSRAGRERYEAIVAIARRVAGSQTIQATAGVLQAQTAEIAARAKDKLAGKVGLGGHSRGHADYSSSGANGYQRAR